YYSESKATLSLSKTGVAYGEKLAGMESLLRILWGIAPLLAGGNEHPQVTDILTGIVNGTNPDHEDYWGDLNDFDQKTVEISSIGYSLLLSPNSFWSNLSKENRKQVADYLRQVNTVKVYDCNWLFFAVLVNLGLKNVGESYDQTI